MVIGNSAYRATPLPNPVNDARAMADLFAEAGFTVDMRLDSNRADLMAAIEFETFLVEGRGWNSNRAGLEERFWLVPGLNFPVRRESAGFNRGSWFRTERHEPVSLRQQAVGL